MDIHQFTKLLKSYPDMQRMITDCNQKVADIVTLKYEHITIPTSNIEVTYNKGGIHSDPTFQETMKLCDKYDKEIEEAINELDAVLDAAKGIDFLIRRLFYDDITEYRIIKLIYFDNYNWKSAARKINYSVSGARKYHKHGMERALKLWNT